MGLTVGLYRSMDFQRVAMVNSIASIVGSITTLATAFLLRNAWALLLGQVATNICLTVLSYLTARRRPRLDISWSKWAEMWRFGRWEWAAALAYSLYHDGHDLFVGKVLGASALGFYRMGYRLADMATTEGVNAIRKVLFPAFSRIQNDAARLRSAVLSLWEVGAFLGAAFSVALSATSSVGPAALRRSMAPYGPS